MKLSTSHVIHFVIASVVIAAVSLAQWRPHDPTKVDRVQRFGSVIGIKPEKIEYYKQLHANTWPGVLEQISKANIRNYNIFLKQVDEEHWYLFSYFEYVGDDFEADMKRIAADPETQRWWQETDPCQIPIPTRAEGEWWATMERVFFHP